MSSFDSYRPTASTSGLGPTVPAGDASQPHIFSRPADLSSKALHLLSTSVFLHERRFLLHELPREYPSLQPQVSKGEIFSQSLRFEVVAFAAGLKSGVLIGWGDGTNARDARAAARWKETVWQDGVLGDFCGPYGSAIAQREPVVRELRAFLEKCDVALIGPVVTNRGYVLSGHLLLYHTPASADIAIFLANSPTFSSSSASTDSHSSAPALLDEAVVAQVLDYPAPFPADQSPSSPDDHIVVTLGERFKTDTLYGSEYRALYPRDLPAIEAHFLRYEARLAGALFGTVALCLDGYWTDGEKRGEGSRRLMSTSEIAINEAIDRFLRLFDPQASPLQLISYRGLATSDFKSLRQELWRALRLS